MFYPWPLNFLFNFTMKLFDFRLCEWLEVHPNVSFIEYLESDLVNLLWLKHNINYDLVKALWHAGSSQWDSFTQDWSGSEKATLEAIRFAL